jgi:hypothetical protein
MSGRIGDGEEAAADPRPIPARTYINHMRLGISLSEVQIDVGQLSPGEEEAAIQGCFVTSPDYLLSMRSKISGAIDLYQARFGTIVDGGLGGEHGVAGRG